MGSLPAFGDATPKIAGLVHLDVHVCGDGLVEVGESCDDGNLEAGDGCDATCNPEHLVVCGDGLVEAPEACDDGNLLSGDGCDNHCAKEKEKDST